MLRKAGNVKEFCNGNINLKLSSEDIASVKIGRISDIEAVAWTMENIDCYFIGDSFCLSNYEMGAEIYNCYSDKVYIISFTDIANLLLNGKTLKLYAQKPDEYDRQILVEEGYWEEAVN